MWVNIADRNIHRCSHMVRVFQQHHIIAQQYLHQPGEENCTVFTIVGRIVEVLFTEKILIASELLLVGLIDKALLHVFKQGIQSIDRFLSIDKRTQLALNGSGNCPIHCGIGINGKLGLRIASIEVDK